MLKVHPIYRIYGIGFDATVISLVREGFIDYDDIKNLKTVYHLEVADCYGDADDDDDEPMTYEEELELTYLKSKVFALILKHYSAQAEKFVVTVCRKISGELEPIGIIYL